MQGNCGYELPIQTNKRNVGLFPLVNNELSKHQIIIDAFTNLFGWLYPSNH
jgi:hypothetical protein